ncbi:MAG TPA: HAD-IIB family hydrolase [Thermoplasmatales archaeon]|nr:HAD-IIB family hydrolase [Candidatus Thermoplasmatota archaeon]HDS59583.1 HAD-IIB family hydrolase [Thermoplasmatales archaeon]
MEDGRSNTGGHRTPTRVFFSDLDGTLLDARTYSYAPAEPALHLLHKHHLPLVFCTSKTRAEIEYWREEMHNWHPFVSENGGGIFIPNRYFDPPLPPHQSLDGYQVIVLGTPVEHLRTVMQDLQERYAVRSFLQMSPEEVAADARLPPQQARRAVQRDFDIPFKILDKEQESTVLREIERQGLRHVRGGRYHHLTGDSDKGRAVAILIELYRCHYGGVVTIAVGDSENDLPMLERVDRGYLVQRPDGTYASPDFQHAAGGGPWGWAWVVRREMVDVR